MMEDGGDQVEELDAIRGICIQSLKSESAIRDSYRSSLPILFYSS